MNVSSQFFIYMQFFHQKIRTRVYNMYVNKYYSRYLVVTCEYYVKSFARAYTVQVRFSMQTNIITFALYHICLKLLSKSIKTSIEVIYIRPRCRLAGRGLREIPLRVIGEITEKCLPANFRHNFSPTLSGAYKAVSRSVLQIDP